MTGASMGSDHLSQPGDDHTDGIRRTQLDSGLRIVPEDPLRRGISGSQEAVTAWTRDQVADDRAALYRPSNVVVAVAGNIDHNHVVDRLRTALPAIGGGRPPRLNGADGGAPEGFARV